MTTQPQHDVVAAILVRDGRVLLCHRHPNREWYPNVWDLPGGHIEPDELSTTAVQREVREELGVHIQIDTSDPFRTLRLSAALRMQVWVITEWEGEIENHAPDEHDEVSWFSSDQLQQLDLADDKLRELLLDALDLDTSGDTAGFGSTT